MLDPGSRAKRYWGGFGAGKSGVGVEGKITNAAGEVLADVGQDIAKFLGAWATGKDLTKD